MLTVMQRNNQVGVYRALCEDDPDDEYIRAVLVEIIQIDRRVRAQIELLGRIPDSFIFPPITDEIQRVALLLWSQQYQPPVGETIRSEIDAILGWELSLSDSLALQPITLQ